MAVYESFGQRLLENRTISLLGQKSELVSKDINRQFLVSLCHPEQAMRQERSALSL
jgi:hypothetical protein